MNSGVRLSVVVPACNADRDLALCINALRLSDLPRDQWELIVVDDGSSDSTASIAEEAADRVVRTGDVPRGPAYARNRGADVATGEIIAFVDADVALHPDALRLFAERISSDSAIVAVFGSYDDAPAHPSLVSRYRNLLHHYTHHKTAGRVATFWTGCGAVRAASFRFTGGFDEALYPRPQIEDIELGYRLSHLGEIFLCPEIQGAHQKRWAISPMMRTDFFDRALPWVRLLLRSGSRRQAGTPSLGRREIAGTAAAGASVAFAFLALAGFGLAAMMLSAALALVALVLHRGFYAYLWKKGGLTLAAASIPLHFAYLVLSAVAVPIGVFLYLLRDRGRVRGGGDKRATATEDRFLPLALGEIGARVIAFCATALLARRLGASGFGQIAFATAVVAQSGMALIMAVGEGGARDVAREPESAARIAVTGMALRICCVVAAVLGVLIFGIVLDLETNTRIITFLYAVALIPFALDPAWVYKGLGRTGRVGASLIVSEASSLLLLLVFVTSGEHVRRVPGIQFAGNFAAAVFLAIPLLRRKWQFPRLAAVASMARHSRMLMVARMLRTVVVSFDIVVLGLLVSSQEVGWYSAAYRIVFFVVAVIAASHIAFLPEISRSAHEPRVLSLILSRGIGLALTVTLPFVVGGVLIATPLMKLIFGSGYERGAGALQILLVSLVLLGIHGGTRSVFIAMRRLRLDVMIVGCGAIANVGANFALIPVYGIRGAAMATVAGEMVILLGAFGALWRMDIRPRLRESIPPAIAGAVLAATILALGADRPPLQSVVIGGIAYCVAIAALTMLVKGERPDLAAET